MRIHLRDPALAGTREASVIVEPLNSFGGTSEYSLGASTRAASPPLGHWDGVPRMHLYDHTLTGAREASFILEPLNLFGGTSEYSLRVSTR